ncbi:MAG: nitroreductase family protein [Bacillota bacterium]|jgi:hypothetical protein
MTIMQAIRERHSVRSYKDKKIPEETAANLQNEIEKCNRESGLNIRLITDEPQAFESRLAHYGKFRGVQNYIALIGKKSADLDTKAGYYGERIALLAQSLGLNTCWAALTFSKGTVKKICPIGRDEKLVCIIALGYGETAGVPHKSKDLSDVCKAEGEMPDWFKAGTEAALLAPTAMNQQKFRFTLQGNTVSAEATGGFYSKVDLGIVKYHFEIGAGKENFDWQ